MMKSIVSATVLSLMVFSAAWALPAPSSTQLPAASADLVQVKDKGHHGGKNYNRKYKNYKHYNHNYKYNRGRYHYGNRYWGHRYNYRPYGWQTLGCIAVGPIWYCP